MSYIEGWHAIAEANRIFGFDGWDRETIEARCVWQGKQNGRPACAYIARVRMRVRAGDLLVIREGSGFGQSDPSSPGEAHENALKEAETDATKRALSTFGNPFGLALYDREQRGVRQPRRGRAAKETTAVRWVLRAENGQPVDSFQDPAEFCAEFRKLIAAATNPDALKAVHGKNADTLQHLKASLPELKGARGRHYADIIEALIAAQFATLESAPARAPETPERKGTAIDKSVLPLGEPKRIRNKNHLQYVAKQPCIVCGRRPTQAHHLRFMQPNAMGKKVSDEWTVPLCALHHRNLHDAGDERGWWAMTKIEPTAEAKRLWQSYCSVEI